MEYNLKQSLDLRFRALFTVPAAMKLKGYSVVSIASLDFNLKLVM